MLPRVTCLSSWSPNRPTVDPVAGMAGIWFHVLRTSTSRGVYMVGHTTKVASQTICKYLLSMNNGRCQNACPHMPLSFSYTSLASSSAELQHVGLEAYIPASVAFCPYQWNQRGVIPATRIKQLRFAHVFQNSFSSLSRPNSKFCKSYATNHARHYFSTLFSFYPS
jgi:hypothetical protein